MGVNVVDEPSSVIYIGHIPHGFYEDQMLGFFSQFGRVTRIRVSRSKQSGKAKGYAWLEFALPEVAAIAAEAMDGYMMYKQKLIVRLVPVAQQHPELFKGANRKYTVLPVHQLAAQRHNRVRTNAEHTRRLARLVKKDRARQEKLKALGIDYEYKGIQHLVTALRPKRMVFSDSDEEVGDDVEEEEDDEEDDEED